MVIRRKSKWKEWHNVLTRRARELRRAAHAWKISAEQPKSHYKPIKRHIVAALTRAAEGLEQAQHEIEMMEE